MARTIGTTRQSDSPTGPPRGKSQDQRYADARQRYGDSQWYGRAGDANPMPNASSPSTRGHVTPFFTPDAGDPRNAGYYVPENTSMDASIAQAHAANRAAYAADPAYAQAKQSGDLKAQIAAMQAARQGQHRQRFIDQGGQGATWDTRFQQSWPVPASPTGNYQYGPGRPGPTPPGVAGGGASTGTAGVNGPPARTMAGIPNGAQSGGFRRGNGAVGPSGGASSGTMQAQPTIGSMNPNLRMDFGALMGGGYNPGASSGTAGLYGDPSMYNNPLAAMQAQGMYIGGPGPEIGMGQGRQPIGLGPGFGGGRTPINPGGGFPVNVNPGNRPNSVSQWAGMQQGYAPFQGNYGGMPFDMSGMGSMFTPGINYGMYY
jgi:hypothetical protein